MDNNKLITYEEFINVVKGYLKKPKNISLIESAFNYSKIHHEGQFRKSGDPYIQHPLEVSYYLATMKVSPQTLAAGLLHDCLEDTNATREELISLFGEDVYSIVEGVTKISKLKYMTKEKALAKSHQKILLAMAKDVRVILVKLLDRLHNMRTLDFQPEDKQKKIAQETLDLYSPLAHRLGMYRIKAELEDVSLKYLEPEKYNMITSVLQSQKLDREEDINKMSELISNILRQTNIKHYEIKGRIKNIFGINKKMENKHLTLDEIYDLMALRIIVDNVSDCYLVLGLIHSEWNPLPGRFKDYIATPKPNLYQSLHTTVLGVSGKIFEIQIRTFEMDNIAENGIAAHWSYKEENSNYSPAKAQEEVSAKLRWYKEMLNYAEIGENDDEDPLHIIKEDIFSASVYVFTPKGDVLDFPKGATPIDFAYRVHTEVGNRTVGAIINNRMVPLTYHLKTGDVVEIKTNKSFNGPNEAWLKIVKTNHAKQKIVSILNKRKREEYIEKGKEEFERVVKQDSVQIKLDDKVVKEFFSKLSINTVDDLYYILGKGEVNVRSAINKILGTNEKLTDESLIKHYSDPDRPIKRPKSNGYGIYVDGLPKAQIKLATCCNPVNGDTIIGYVSKGSGIIVHRFECHNVKNSIQERFINVYFDTEETTFQYETVLLITSYDRRNILADIINIINSLNSVTILSITSNKNKLGELLTKAKISVTTTQVLENVIANVNKLSDIYTIERLMK